MKLMYYWGPVFVWMIIIFLLSSRQRISVSETASLNFLFFKTLHIIEYAFLFLLLQRAIHYGTSWKKHYKRIAFLVTVLYAISDEFHQTLVPTREGHIRDVIIDATGAIIAWILIRHIPQKLPKKLKILAERWHII